MVYFYLFALIVGGVLLAAAALLGSGDHDGDSAIDASHDVDAHGKHIGEIPADVAGLLWIFRSLRFWTFFLAFFGLTGMTLGGLGLVDSKTLVALLSLVMGLGCGFAAAKIIQRLSVADTDSAISTKDYIGKSARVLVAMNAKQTGKIRVQVRGTTIDLLASGINGGSYAIGDQVFIVQMDDTNARVTHELDRVGK
ncbi:MAG: DUF1449 family protein [Sandaracinaceae bacterium]|jgi:membrane protein implicated in regulation of membrane protease activity|nr:DUF1449 family protein [Sandaracinaceae bacterium]